MQNENSAIFPFRNYIDAIICYRFKNPARSKSVNLLEPEGGTREHFDPFDPRCRERIFAAVIHSIEAVKKNVTLKQWRAFKACRIGTIDTAPMGATDYARSQGVSHQTVYRWLYAVEEQFTKELVQRALIPEQNEEKKYNNARKNYEAHKKEKEAAERGDIHRERARDDNRVVYRS